MESLRFKNKVVGVKQVKSAVENYQAETVYIAEDADIFVVEPIKEVCSKFDVEIKSVESRKELGKVAGIDVKTAALAILK